MKPHLFAHFLPQEGFRDITPEGFRSAGLEEPAGKDLPILYLAGDCTFFEDHLPVEETFAHHLAAGSPGLRVLNAGVPHYTLQHSLHRLLVDVVRGIRPKVVLLTGGADDTLSFIHHKQGRWAPDHSHFYRPWGAEFALYRWLDRIPGAVLRQGLAYALLGRRRPQWDRMAEAISPDFQEEASVRTARSLFETQTYAAALALVQAVCVSIDASLVLATFAYCREDMAREPRATYAWGIDRMNETTRRFAQAQGIPLIDWAEGAPFGPEEIRNKWHYTAEGNRRRARLALARLAGLPLGQARETAGVFP